MTIILLLTMIVCGFMLICGATKWALSVAIVSVVGCFSFRIWFEGSDLQSVLGDVFFCLMLMPLGWYGAEQFIKLNETTDS